MEKPKDAVARLGVGSDEKLIGGRTVKAIRFESWGHEHKYLREVGGSFCGRCARRILESAEDLALMAFVATRCASHTLGEVMLAAASAGQVTRRDEELSKSLELAESTKAALEKANETLTARVAELERSLATVIEERDSFTQEARQAKLSLKDLERAVEDWKASHAVGSPILKQSLTRLFNTFRMTTPDRRLFGDDIGGLYDYLVVCIVGGSQC